MPSGDVTGDGSLNSKPRTVIKETFLAYDNLTAAPFFTSRDSVKFIPQGTDGSASGNTSVV
jgi:hypothetical protein